MKNYHLDLVRVTEAAALSAAKWVGRGDKEQADLAATQAMRERLNSIDFLARIAVGEGKKDNSHGLFKGEFVGCGSTPSLVTPGAESCDPRYSIAVDPIEGTTPTAMGGYEAMSVIAMADKNNLWDGDQFYAKKLAVGPGVDPSYFNIKKSLTMNIRGVAYALGKQVEHITICMLNRSRHNEWIEEARSLGCRLKLISDCDVTACIATCFEESGIDMYYGIGGSPEAVIAAAALRCLKGHISVQFCDEALQPEEIVHSENELARGDVMFCATGITDGSLLKGVQFMNRGPVTHSIAMRSESGTVRRIITEHGN